MNAQEINHELKKLAPQIKRIAEIIADSDGITDSTPEGRYMRNMLSVIGEKLDDAAYDINVINAPVVDKGNLFQNSDGRYELPSGQYFTSGSSIEFFHSADPDYSRWVRTSVEHDRDGYYLVGYKDVCMDGLTVRVKKLTGY